MYLCPFDDCLVSSSTPRFAKRHMREVHFDDIPYGVFDSDLYKMCDSCLAGPFIGQKDLNKHKKNEVT